MTSRFQHLSIAAAAALLVLPPRAGAQCLPPDAGVPFDFRAGGTPLFFTDFSTDSLGRPPRGLEAKSGALIVVERDGRRMLRASDRSAFAIPLGAALPARFTLELGLVHRNSRGVGAPTVQVYGGRVALSDFATASTRATFGLDYWEVSGGGAKAEGSLSDYADGCVGQQVDMRLVVDGGQLTLYGDERVIASVADAQFMRGRGLVVQLEGRDTEDNAVYVTYVRLAGGEPAAGVVAAAPPESAPASAPASSAPASPTSTGTPPTSAPPASAPPVSAPPVSAPPLSTTAAAIPPAAAPAPATPTTYAPPKGTTSPATPTSAKAPTGLKQPQAMDRGTKTATLEPDPAEQPLPAITGVTATHLGAGRVAMRWNAVPGAQAYWLMYRRVGETEWRALHTSAVTATQFVTAAVDSGIRLAPGASDVVVVPTRDVAAGIPDARAGVVRLDVPRWYGTYRVTLNGFRVHRETLDNQLETDGKRDEVFARVTYREYRQDGSAAGPERVARTLVHGDVNAERWKRPGTEAFRYQAGSASALGGLRSGDGVPSATDPWNRAGEPTTDRFPLFIWEGMLAEGINTVNISPMLFEDDETPLANDPAVEAVRALGGLLAVQGRELVSLAQYNMQNAPPLRMRPALELEAAPIQAKAALAIAGAITGRVNTFIARDRALTLQIAQSAQAAYAAAMPNIAMAVSLLTNSRTRPIGVTAIEGGKMIADPYILRLDFKTAEAYANTRDPNSPMPAGIVTVRYTDTVPGGSGDYTLYLQVVRLN
jgi:hypothetical protein